METSDIILALNQLEDTRQEALAIEAPTHIMSSIDQQIRWYE